MEKENFIDIIKTKIQHLENGNSFFTDYSTEIFFYKSFLSIVESNNDEDTLAAISLKLERMLSEYNNMLSLANIYYDHSEKQLKKRVDLRSNRLLTGIYIFEHLRNLYSIFFE